MEYFKLDLQMFADEGGAAAAAPEAGTAPADPGAAGSEPADPSITTGDTLGDGTKVPSAKVAAALERQMKKHPELRAKYAGQATPADPAAAEGRPGAEPAGKSIEERWEEAKKGEFADLYGRDVQGAIKERFKNQADANEKLNSLEPMLKVLRERAGVESNEDLVKQVMDDDSLYEDAANEAGMTIPAYKQFMQMKAENEAIKAKEEQDIKDRMLDNHIRGLFEQGQKMKEKYPDFDLNKELKNEKFFRLTSPGVNVSVEDAYFAVHHKELAPQMMAYGMQRARVQMGQTLQAQQRRPAEGAMRSQGTAAAEMKIDPSKLTRKEREEIKRQVHMRKRVSFD